MSAATNDRDVLFMRQAIEASRSALAAGNNAFGAALVAASGEPLLVAENNQHTAADPTGHAESVLVREAAKRFGLAALRGGTIYASGEPCAMCTGAMYWAGIERVVFAASSDATRRTIGAPYLAITSRDVVRGASRTMRIDGPLLEEEALAVLREMARVQGRSGA